MNPSFDALLKALNPENIQQLSSMTGLKPDKTQAAITQIVPVMLKGLADNAQKPGGADALAKALEKDHNGSILDNVMSAFANGDKPEDTGRDTDGLGIVNHIFGGQQANVVNQLSNSLGIDQQTILSIMGKLAPILMGFLGKTKKDGNLGGQDLGSLLTMATTMLGQNKGKGGQGDLMGSLMKMGSELLGNQAPSKTTKGKGKSKPASGSPLMDIGSSLLKGFLNKKK